MPLSLDQASRVSSEGRCPTHRLLSLQRSAPKGRLAALWSPAAEGSLPPLGLAQLAVLQARLIELNLPINVEVGVR